MTAWIASCSTPTSPWDISRAGSGTWWRRWHGNATRELDNARLMRHGRPLPRRVPGLGSGRRGPGHRLQSRRAQAPRRRGVPGQQNRGAGVFMILVAQAPASGVGGASVPRGGDLQAGEKEGLRQPLFLPHHGPDLGHVAIKMSGHPPFGAQIILNGHEYVVRLGAGQWTGLHQGGKLFTRSPTPRVWLRSQIPCLCPRP